MRPDSLAVLGLGAIGGSLAWQARLAGVPRVVGYSPQRAEAVQALRATALTDIAETPEQALAAGDFVVLAAPPAATLGLLDLAARHLKPGAFITDVASVKLPVLARAVSAGLAGRFAGSHPFAGTHASGWSAAAPERLRGAVVYVCATAGSEGVAAAREVMNFWREVIEAQPVLLDAAVHDRQLGWTSHLPQAVAYALAATLASEPSLLGASYGSGARDTMRLAGSNPELWVDIFLQNAAPVAAALGRTESELSRLRELLTRGDAPGLQAWLERAQAFRQSLD